jgi:hypothetical protein
MFSFQIVKLIDIEFVRHEMNTILYVDSQNILNMLSKYKWKTLLFI